MAEYLCEEDMSTGEYISRDVALRQLNATCLATDCDNYNGVRCRACAYADAMDFIDAIPAADVQSVPQWINVKDRLPDKDGNYLCYLECGAVCEAAFDSTIASEGEEFPFGEWVGVYNSDTLGFTDSYWEEYDAITHWMPLPEPPKDGDTNE